MAGMTIFCLPYAGGSAQRVYAGWQARLEAAGQVVPVELPGRGTRIAEPLLPSVDALVQDALGAVLPRLGGRGYAMFGHSLGALIVFELARRLEHLHGQPPSRLFVSGHPAPHLPPNSGDALDLPLPQFRERLAGLAGTPEEILASDELLELFAPLIQADLHAAGTYRFRPGPALSCPVTVYGGADDPEAPPETLPGWARHTSARCEVRVLPGDHFFLHNERDVLLPQIAADLRAHWPAGQAAPGLTRIPSPTAQAPSGKAETPPRQAQARQEKGHIRSGKAP
jgi:surfactin synthase thioesterase subunit